MVLDMLGVPSEQFDHLICTHGTSGHIEFPNRLQSFRRSSTGLHIVGREGRNNKIHFAIPTTLLSSNVRLSIHSVILDFTATSGAFVNTVQILDGKRQIAKLDNLNMSGEHRFEIFEVPKHPSLNRGVGVSVHVGFPIDGERRTIDFVSACANFVVKTGRVVIATG